MCLNNVQTPGTGLNKEDQSSSFERLCIVSNEFETLSEMFDVAFQKDNNFEFCANQNPISKIFQGSDFASFFLHELRVE